MCRIDTYSLRNINIENVRITPATKNSKPINIITFLMYPVLDSKMCI